MFVDAGIRGGSEYGETWHEQAMFARKQNTFDDMVAVAEWLVAEKYTQPAKLAVEGGSNGGLTVGALLTQRPDLFRAAICQVPLLDMVRYHKFLIARYWIAEYGDPDRAADFRWILRYSPYQNVRQGVNMPETLVVAGPRKFQDFERSLSGISPNTLSARLKRLEEAGIVERHFYEQHPPRAEYVLTKKGEALRPVLRTLFDWGQRHTQIPRPK